MEELIPTGWQIASIGEVTLPIEKTDPSTNPDQMIDYLDISGIDNKTNRIVEAKHYLGKDAPSRARQLIKQDDILFSTVRTYLKNIAMVPVEYEGQVASTGFSILRAAEGINSKFLFYYTLTQNFLNPLTELQRGSSYPAVRDDDVRIQKMPIAPYNEQKRIVAKIDELLSELDNGIESLETAREQLRVYRQAVLKHAFEGKLTAHWREQNKDELESADQLLDRIEHEREANYRQQLEEWNTAVKIWEKSNQKNRKPSKPSQLKDSLAINKTSLPLLPDKWAWIALGEILLHSPQNGIYKPADAYGSGTQIIRIDDFYDGRLIKKSGFKRLALSLDEQIQYSVLEGEIIINRVNSIEYLGKCALIRGLSEATVFESNIMRTSFLKTVSSEYLALYLSSQDGRKRLCVNAKHAVNQASINQTDVASTPVPLPSYAEQCELFLLLETKLNAIDLIELEIEINLQKSEALRQSMLKKAFSGKLVAQDPNDEPASVLLERIRAEKEAQKTESNKPKTKRKAA